MTAEPTNSVLAPRFLFRFAVPVQRREPIWQPGGLRLDETCRLPDLASLDASTDGGERRIADVRMAWSFHGLALNVAVDGKGQPPWCREGRLEDSDGLQLWIDTRATLNVHRASRYCHRFVFLPAGGGPQHTQPIADQLLINRARENARPIRPRELQVASKLSKSSYWLAAFIPAAALGGYDPQQHRQLGFTYAIYDRELGMQTFANGPGFPFDEDPTCWAAVDLVDLSG
jgi:hypothetical protein